MKNFGMLTEQQPTSDVSKNTPLWAAGLIVASQSGSKCTPYSCDNAGVSGRWSKKWNHSEGNRSETSIYQEKKIPSDSKPWQPEHEVIVHMRAELNGPEWKSWAVVRPYASYELRSDQSSGRLGKGTY